VPAARLTLGFLPLGTGNSFLRDFGERGLERPLQAILSGRSRPCDVLRLTHRLPAGSTGVVHGINLFSVGFPADVGALVNRRLKPFGYLGYTLGILFQLGRFRRRPFPVRLDDDRDADRRPCLFLSFNNSRYTGGNMLVAPLADVADGLIEYVRLNPIGRLELLRNLRRLYDGTSVSYANIERRAIRAAAFDLDGPVDVMADGEILSLHCERLDILPAALQVLV
jgi:diacylglycerol kinase (ATP)